MRLLLPVSSTRAHCEKGGEATWAVPWALTWAVLGTDLLRDFLYTSCCWMRSTRIHADWGRAGGLTKDPSLFLGLHLPMIADGGTVHQRNNATASHHQGNSQHGGT